MSGIGAVSSAGDGYFMVNGQKMDMGALQMMLQIDRTKEIDKSIADQMSQIRDRNAKLKAMNTLLGKMREWKTNGSDDETKIELSIPGANGTTVTKNMELEDWATELGFSYSDIKGSRPKGTTKKNEWNQSWDSNIENIKSAIDSLNSDSQLDMIRLQSLIDKRNQAFEMASNSVQKDQKTRDSIVGNFR